MKQTVIFACLCVLTLLLSTAYGFNSLKPDKQYQKVIPTNTPLREDKLWSVVQDWRSQESLPIYILDERLCDKAEIRLAQTEKDYSHNNWRKVHKNEAGLFAENLAYNYPSEKALLLAWLHSPAHRKNLEDTFTHSCIATDGSYVVQLFAEYE